MPDQLRRKFAQRDPSISSCTASFFTEYDLPRALVPASGLLPFIYAGTPKPAPVPSPTLDPGPMTGGDFTLVPLVLPSMDQLKATANSASIPSHGRPIPTNDSNNPAALEYPTLQPHSNPEDPDTNSRPGASPSHSSDF